MNYLRELMRAKGITATELSKMSGVSQGCISRMLKMSDITFSYKHTQKALADALGVTVNELVNGGGDMKNKILESEVRKAAESLAVALRKYTTEPMYCSLIIFTKDVTCKCDEDPEGIPDYYSFRVHEAEDVEEHYPTFSESARVYYDDEGIRYVIPFSKE